MLRTAAATAATGIHPHATLCRSGRNSRSNHTNITFVADTRDTRNTRTRSSKRHGKSTIVPYSPMILLLHPGGLCLFYRNPIQTKLYCSLWGTTVPKIFSVYLHGGVLKTVCISCGYHRFSDVPTFTVGACRGYRGV